jgi:hypothetical protein
MNFEALRKKVEVILLLLKVALLKSPKTVEFTAGCIAS